MASSSSGGYDGRYDVFLSFRGEDIRDSFTDHLYDALRRATLNTFRDNRGEDLKPEIERGIRESRASIIVLSEMYATSRWCLDELCLILDQRKERNHFVLPIFYHVDPSHVRKQDGPFKIEVKANTKWTEENVGRWKAALEKVGNMTGVTTSGSLLSVSPNNELMIHQLLQVMEKTIVDDESHTHPGNRSRVWQDGETHNVLIKEKPLAVYESLLAKDKLQLLQLKDAKLSDLNKNFTELSKTSLYRASMTSSQTCRRFNFAEIQSATNDFDDELVVGEGGFAKVYIGQINSEESKQVVAIKRLNHMANQGALEFTAEIKVLSKLRYRHLVSLIGYCDDNKEMILVYEYMPRGTLHDHLQKAKTPLSWLQRIKIAIGAALGFDYLHNGVSTQQGIIHRDVKSANILLDEKCEAMIADFGVSKIGRPNHSLSNLATSVKGTFGYIDPDYFYTGQLTRKTDVYAFGVVLFELLSGMRAVDTRLEKDQRSLVLWARRCVKELKLDHMVDSKIRGTIGSKSLKHFTQLADQCLLKEPAKRPTMAKVVSSLRDILELQEKYDRSTNSRFCF